ncbi:MAG: hypothetical protein JRN32_01540 [Nitrososphaerota archaeon]|jgi:hypothetical protein|nr:hypothetical protein [Nitrososphaerota archaeon]MDG7038614.1 hypothetical protein [Nitrososphaerota archaeon]MDG7043061.1 hypothetical protein [Nitrososphaerota archaeon]MDG7045483.1 hypothetical protein [Nitrososphaerota archaeon]
MRASLSVDRGIADEFSTQAEHKGKTLYAFANEWIEVASKISAEGGTAQDVLGHWRVCSILKQVEIITLPADFVEELISKLYATEKENLLNMFAKLGEDLVGLMKMVAPDIEQLGDLAIHFAEIIPTKKIDIRRTDGNSLEVNVIGAGRMIETTECSFEFIKAILNGYGYSVASQELHVGTIMIKCSKRNLRIS